MNRLQRKQDATTSGEEFLPVSSKLLSVSSYVRSIKETQHIDYQGALPSSSETKRQIPASEFYPVEAGVAAPGVRVSIKAGRGPVPQEFPSLSSLKIPQQYEVSEQLPQELQTTLWQGEYCRRPLSGQG